MPETGIEPVRSYAPRDFKSLVSANSTTPAQKNWRRRADLNRCIEVLQTSALPLGYVASLAGLIDFIPMPVLIINQLQNVFLLRHLIPCQEILLNNLMIFARFWDEILP